jgi:hypothetical protein
VTCRGSHFNDISLIIIVIIVICQDSLFSDLSPFRVTVLVLNESRLFSDPLSVIVAFSIPDSIGISATHQVAFSIPVRVDFIVQ